VSAVHVPALVHARSGRLRTAAAALRLPQWVKNTLLFAGLLFAGRLAEASAWGAAAAAFAAFCTASSAAYLVNDVRDAGRDRLHPVKRHRPVASGAVSPTLALVLAGMLLAVSLAAGVGLGARFALFLLGFVILQAGYSFVLKHVVALDVAAIATLFVLRAAAGAAAIHVRISPWLLACTALLALFLALAKRRGELLLVRAGETPGRPVLSLYSAAVLDRLLAASAVATLAAYAAYTFTARDSVEMAVTLPVVAFALIRYLVLVWRDGVGEQPERVLWTDAPILASAALWAIVAAFVLTSG
jgi:4-hydroxybenzoate polyprenyltransferase